MTLALAFQALNALGVSVFVELEVFLEERRVGILAQAPGGNFSFTYDAPSAASLLRCATSATMPP